MVIVFAAVVRFVPFDGGGEFRGQRFRPFLPREMSLRGETDCERECLRLPRFFKHRASLVARQALQLRVAARIVRRVQDSHPTNRCRRSRAVKPALPKAPERQSAPNIHAGVLGRSPSALVSGKL